MLKRAIAERDASCDLANASWCRAALAEIYLEILSSERKVPLTIIFRNFDIIIAAKLFGPRRIRVLLEHVAQYEHFNPEGTIRARLYHYFGLLHKIEGKSHLAREHFQKAFALARLEQATGLANKVAEDLKRCA